MFFWKNVEALRREQNTTYRWLASKMGVSETTVSSMRKAGTVPRATEAVKLASALNVSVEYLVSSYESSVPKETKKSVLRLVKDLNSLSDDDIKAVSAVIARLKS
jgi:transcriptional regulator with XRE-family HTH domain